MTGRRGRRIVVAVAVALLRNAGPNVSRAAAAAVLGSDEE
jgi:hypothetical protein